MKYKLAMLCFGVVFSGSVIAQTLSPTVISATGGFTTSGSVMLSSTVGEMAMVETFSNSNVILTQGFQQPEDFNVGVKDVNSGVAGITVSPNPSQGIIKLIFGKKEELDLTISIFDISGRVIYSTDTRKEILNNFISLDLTTLAAGNYILECKSSGENKKSPVFLSEKITLTR